MDGRFSFVNLPPGTYRLLAAKAAGECTTLPNTGNTIHGGLDTRFRWLRGTAMREVKLEMAATGSISGRILDEDGSPAARVQVLLFESSWQSGRARLGLKQSAVTDDRGEYRLYFLPPGRYFIGASLRTIHASRTSVFADTARIPARRLFPRRQWFKNQRVRRFD
jgi:protocatechuate 3,4-dioxygenase beta subunit